jgi:hypothetical protein
MPFVLKRAQTATPATSEISTFDTEGAAPAAADRSDGLALKVASYVLVTVVGPAAAVFGIAALLPN